MKKSKNTLDTTPGLNPICTRLDIIRRGLKFEFLISLVNICRGVVSMMMVTSLVVLKCSLATWIGSSDRDCNLLIRMGKSTTHKGVWYKSLGRFWWKRNSNINPSK